MPLKIENIKLAGTKFDGRAKLSPEQRQAIQILAREGYSQRLSLIHISEPTRH